MKNNTIKNFKSLYLHLTAKHKTRLFFLFVLMIFSSISEVVSIGAIMPFLGVLISPNRILEIDRIKNILLLFDINNSDKLIFYVTTFFIISVIISAIVRFLLLWAQTRICYSIGADFSSNIYKRTLHQPYLVHLNRNSSDLISGILNKSNSIIHGALIPILTIVNSILIILATLFLLLKVDYQITIISFVGFAIIYIAIILIQKKNLYKNSLITAEKSNIVVKNIQEGLGGIRDVLLDGTQNIYYEIFRNADLPLRRAQANIVIMSGSPRFIIESLIISLIAILAYTLSGNSNSLTTAIPILGTLVLGAQRMLPVMQYAYTSWTSIKGSEASLCDTIDLLNQPILDLDHMYKSKILQFSTKIILQDVSFKYSDDSPWVLKNINLQINKGSKIGIIGMTGSGKSTLLDIIMSLILPTTGKLIVDEVEINHININNWQKNIAHVPQSIFLTDSTIMENIAFGISKDLIDKERVVNSAKKAQIAQTIEKWDKGYDNIVGERGAKLSGGQRQRIGIARALYKNANLIIFDEATSALDTNTENEIIESIDNLDNKLTILIVAHRTTTLKNCNHIIELNNGEISWQGTYLEMLQMQYDKNK
jgi:ABC-type multidrug transport system fused ATPase/permease subunit